MVHLPLSTFDYLLYYFHGLQLYLGGKQEEIGVHHVFWARSPIIIKELFLIF